MLLANNISTELLNILLAALGTIITGLCTWLVKVITNWLNTKSKNVKFNTFILSLTEITTTVVKELYQTSVDTYKKDGNFDKEKQKEVLDIAVKKITEQLSDELSKFICNNFGDIETYLIGLIESIIYDLKNKK